MAQLLKRTAIRTSKTRNSRSMAIRNTGPEKRHTIFLCVHNNDLSSPYPSQPSPPPPPPPPLYFDKGHFFVIKILGKWRFRMTAREASSPYVICFMYFTFLLGYPLILFVLAIICRKRGEENCGLSTQDRAKL